MLLVSSLISLWEEIKIYVISILNVFRFILWYRMWFILVYGLCIRECIFCCSLECFVNATCIQLFSFSIFLLILWVLININSDFYWVRMLKSSVIIVKLLSFSFVLCIQKLCNKVFLHLRLLHFLSEFTFLSPSIFLDWKSTWYYCHSNFLLNNIHVVCLLSRILLLAYLCIRFEINFL